MSINSYSFYRQKHEKWTQINSALVPGNINELDRAIETDPELKKLLTSPQNELPSEYLYLIAEEFPNSKNYTLYDLIKLSMDYKNITSFFSKSGDKLTGWCAYRVATDIRSGISFVDEIKMFSFNGSDRINPVLIRDLKSLLDDLLTKYPIVSWAAVKENPANKIYIRALEEYESKGFSVKTVDKGTNVIYAVGNLGPEDK